MTAQRHPADPAAPRRFRNSARPASPAAARLVRRALPPLLCLLLAAPAAHGQANEERVLDLRVLAWNRNIDELHVTTRRGPERIKAAHGTISPTYKGLVDDRLTLYTKHENPDEPEPDYRPALTEEVPSGMREGLLVLHGGDGEYRGMLIPFSESEVPYNSINAYNLTPYRIAAEIDGERHAIPSRQRISIPFEFDPDNRGGQFVRSRFAAEIGDDWRTVQNGFITLIPDARILYFITADFASERERRNRPVRFTYIRDRVRSEEARREITEIEYTEFGDPDEPGPGPDGARNDPD